MTANFFRSIILSMRDTTKRQIGICDSDGYVLSCSDVSKVGAVISNIDANYGKVFSDSVNTYCQIVLKNDAKKFYAFAEGSDEVADVTAKLIAVSIQNEKPLYDDKYDVQSFIKNILSNNISTVKIFSRASEFGIEYNLPRRVFLISVDKEYNNKACIALQRLTSNPEKNLILPVNDDEILLIKENNDFKNHDNIMEFVNTIKNTLIIEVGNENINLGVSSRINSLRELPEAVKQARTAIRISSIFFDSRICMCYNKLGVSSLIYQVAPDVCGEYLRTIIKEGNDEIFNDEMTETINLFFANNLNLSETARAMEIHRNTLVYRLEKIKKMTELDLRKFSDAVDFFVALLTHRYVCSLRNGAF